MEVNITRQGKVAIASANGRLDSNSATVFEERLTQVIETEPVIVLDMSGLSYVSSAGLRILLMAAKKCKANGRKLALCGLTPEVNMVFDISGFLALFTICANTAEAVATFSCPGNS